MRALRAWIMRVGGVLGRRRHERDFDEQMQADIDLQIEDGIRAGLGESEARRAALVSIGGVAAAKEAWRDRRGLPVLETFLRDVLHASRVLRRNKGWSAVAILSLALGVGANAAVFSAAYALLLRPLPLPDAANLVTLRWEGENKAWTGFVDYGYVPGSFGSGWLAAQPDFSTDALRGGVTGAFATYRRLDSAQRTLTELFASGRGPTVNLIVDGYGDTATSQFVSGNYFAALRLAPAAGRLIQPADDAQGAPPVVVLSHGYWLRRFGGSPSVIGKEVRINAAVFTIVGVSAAGLPDPALVEPAQPELSIPIAGEPLFAQGESRLEQTTNWWLVMMGRLRPGIAAHQVEADLGPLYEQVTRDAIASLIGSLPSEDQQEARKMGFGTKIPRLRVVSAERGAYDPLHPALRFPLAILGILAAIVLLVVWVNLGNLSLALTTAREREIAVRRAIGAAPGRIVRQVLTEHALVAVLGGAASLGSAWLFQQLLRTYFAAPFDSAVIGFTFAIAALTGIVVGTLPALRASRGPEMPQPGGGSSRRSRLASGLLVSQVVLSFVLLIGAGLFLRTLYNIRAAAPGFDAERLALLTIDPAFNQYDDVEAGALYGALAAEFKTLPGVSSVSFSSQALVDGNFSQRSAYAPETAGRKYAAYLVVAAPDFFSTLGIPLRAGRVFGPQDPVEPKIAVINEALAASLFGDANPVGRRFGMGMEADEDVDTEIVGVVANTVYGNLRTSTPRMIFIPHAQSAGGPRTFQVRTAGSPADLLPAIKKIVAAADSSLPIVRLSTQASVIESQSEQERTIALASVALGTLTLAVSMIGLFGLMSYTVSRRTRDIAIRMALGADKGGVLRSILRQGLVLVGFGTALGLAVALLSTRFLAAFLFGLAPHDPIVLIAAVLLMLGVAVLAAYLPARRAASIDPIAALRQD